MNKKQIPLTSKNIYHQLHQRDARVTWRFYWSLT